MKVYVAASQHEYLRAREAMNVLRAAGIEITHDWTLEVERHREIPPTIEELRGYALADYRGVKHADALLLLVPDNPHWGCGLWTELGIALGHDIHIVVSGAGVHRNIFTLMANEYVDTDGDGINSMLDEAVRLELYENL